METHSEGWGWSALRWLIVAQPSLYGTLPFVIISNVPHFSFNRLLKIFSIYACPLNMCIYLILGWDTPQSTVHSHQRPMYHECLQSIKLPLLNPMDPLCKENPWLNEISPTKLFNKYKLTTCPVPDTAHHTGDTLGSQSGASVLAMLCLSLSLSLCSA